MFFIRTISSRFATRSNTAGISRQQSFAYTTTIRNMAAQSNSASQVISETAHQEGGPAKGSDSAQMQSQVGKTRNLEEAAQEIGQKMQNAPETVTAEDAAYLKSREARAIGQGQPPAGSISADAQKLASANERGELVTGSAPTDPASQSAVDRVENFDQVASKVAKKMATQPESLTKEDADLTHSREHRAFGATSKGGIASQAQSLASENEGKTS